MDEKSVDEKSVDEKSVDEKSARRAGLGYGAGAALGLVLVLWLLGTSTTRDFYDPSGPSTPANQIVCASVLHVPTDASNRGMAGGDRSGDGSPSDSRMAEACEAYRNRALGLSVLVTGFSGLAAMIAINRRREATS